MRRFVDWIAGLLGAIIAYGLWKRWRRPAPVTAPAADESDDRAEELRSKLAETRANDEPAPDETPGSVEERRRQVHEEGRAAIDRMTDG